MAARSPAFFSFLNALGAQELTFGGLESLMTVASLFPDQAGNSFPGGTGGKELPANAADTRQRFNSCVGKNSWRRARQLTLVFLPGASHGQRSLAGYSP